MTLGENIKRLRAERGMAQQNLADKAGISYGALFALEHDTRKRGPNPVTLAKIARALDVDVDELVGKPTPEVVIDFGAWLTGYRERQGMTMGDLGEVIGISKQTVGNWEAGRTIPPRHEVANLLWRFSGGTVGEDEALEMYIQSLKNHSKRPRGQLSRSTSELLLSWS